MWVSGKPNDQGHRQPPGSGPRQRIQRPMNLPHRLAPRLAAVRWTALLCVLGCGPSKPGSNRRKKAPSGCQNGSDEPKRHAAEQPPGGNTNNARRTLRPIQPPPTARRLVQFAGEEMSCLLRITTKLTHSRDSAGKIRERLGEIKAHEKRDAHGCWVQRLVRLPCQARVHGTTTM